MALLPLGVSVIESTGLGVALLDGTRSIGTTGMPIEHQAGGIGGEHLPDLQFGLQQAYFALKSINVFRQGALCRFGGGDVRFVTARQQGTQ